MLVKISDNFAKFYSIVKSSEENKNCQAFDLLLQNVTAFSEVIWITICGCTPHIKNTLCDHLPDD